MNVAAHLVVVPVVLPLAAAALLVSIDERRHALKAAISLACIVLLLAAAIALMATAGAPRLYALGDWPAPFGIVLVADRLSVAMVTLAAVLALAATVFSLARWQRAGSRFHALVQFLLMGLDGAFLTGDLFNLFVFFELLLAASYGLALYGSGAARVLASLHYIVINLTASLFFLVGVALVYGVTGTLNMADLAQRIPAVPAGDRFLVEAGAAVMSLAFLLKAGMWPLGFWLPSTYAAASPPAAALLSILSKVGVYALLRLWLLLFRGEAAGFLLAVGGMATLVFAITGVLASQGLGRIAGYSLLASSGMLLASFGAGGVAAVGPALYYLMASTLGIAALFLLIELVQRARQPGADVIGLTAEAFGMDAGEKGEEEAGRIIPAVAAILGLSFMGCALLVAGLPPFPGFIGKFALLAALLRNDAIGPAAWTLLALVVASGLASLIAFARAGIRIFWATQWRALPRVRVIEIAPVAMLLALLLGLTAKAGPALAYFEDAARELAAPAGYIEAVLGRR